MTRSALLGALLGTLLAAASAPTARSAAGPAVHGIVDINTNLSFQRESAAGTGVVLTRGGVVLTNNHVIRGATTIRVRDVDNGRTYSAKVLGYDVSADIAVLQVVGASGLETADLGSSASAEIGEGVTGYGNAGGVGGAPIPAAGKIVSLGKTIIELADDGGSQELTGLIVVDAPIRPGDSGGPLVDAHGRVIGIDTALSFLYEFAPSAPNRGFAVPIGTARSIAARIEAGRASRAVHVGPTAFLGLVFQPSAVFSGLTPGLTVVSVSRGSPAGKAGVEAGDVVHTLDGKKIATSADLATLMLGRAPGARLELSWTDVTGVPHSATVVAGTGPPQ